MVGIPPRHECAQPSSSLVVVFDTLHWLDYSLGRVRVLEDVESIRLSGGDHLTATWRKVRGIDGPACCLRSKRLGFLGLRLQLPQVEEFNNTRQASRRHDVAIAVQAKNETWILDGHDLSAECLNEKLPDSVYLPLAERLVEGDFALASHVDVHHITFRGRQEEGFGRLVAMIYLHALDPRVIATVSAVANFVLVLSLLVVARKDRVECLPIDVEKTDGSIITRREQRRACVVPH